MLYPITTIIAIDQATGARVENGSGYVYALSDTARATPLSIFDLSGLPLTSNLLTTNSEALIPPFQVEGEWQVVFVSGDSEIILTSYLGLKEEAAASADAANTVVTRADNGEFKGAQGDSAYQVWLSLGNVGTVEDYRADIEGAPGKDGSNVLPTDEAITQAINDTASSTRGALNATYAPIRDYHVLRYGTFDETATAEVNAASVQAANDACAAFGGGRVVLADGVFDCIGVVQDSRVEIYGPGTTLRHPDGDGIDIIKARTYSTTGTMAAGSDSLTVASATGIEVGSVLGVRGADGYSPLQFTTLTAAITSTQTLDITLADATGYPSTGYLVVGSEIIGYSGLTGSVLTGVTRGFYGTATAAHTAGTNIGYAMRLLAEVTAVNGTTITLDRPAEIAVTDAPVTTGIVKPAITGIRFDGNRPVGGALSTTSPIRWDLVRWGRIRDIESYRCESAFFLQASRDCLIDGVEARECSVPEGSKGAVFWLFQQCHRNILNNLNVSGDMWSGVYLDNRTSLATEWDGGCDGNTGTGWVFNVTPHDPWITNTALNIIGSNGNQFGNIVTNHVRTGMLLEGTTQVYTADGSIPTTEANKVNGFTMENGFQPYIIHAPGNVVTNLTYDAAANGTNEGGSLIALSGTMPGGAPTLGQFPDGSQTAPGISFGSDTNTGFWRIADGQVQFVSNSALIVRFRSTGVYFNNGVNLEFQTGAGTMVGTSADQKLAFWGTTPVTRPVANPDTTGATLTGLETEVNELKALLRTVGLMAP